MTNNKALDFNWSEHVQNMSGLFHNLYANNKLVDVTLSCREGSIRAHKMILSICSPFFQRILEENPCKHPVLILQKTSLSDLQRLLDFMYTGKLSVQEGQLSTLMQTADELDVTSLRACIEQSQYKKKSGKRNIDTHANVVAKKMNVNGQENAPPPKPENEVAPHGRDTRFKGKKRVEVHHDAIYKEIKIPKSSTKSSKSSKSAAHHEADTTSGTIKQTPSTESKAIKREEGKAPPTTAEVTTSNGENFVPGELIPEIQFAEGEEEISTAQEESDGDLSEVKSD